jgi:hypothetical protein
MDKASSYKVPSKADLAKNGELKGKGRKGIVKHFVLRYDLDRLVSDYAKKLGVSQAKVLEEMIEVGVARFELNHGFRIVEKRIEFNEKREAILTEQLNEKETIIREQKKRDSAKKTNDLTDSYSKRIVHGNSDDWQSV